MSPQTLACKCMRFSLLVCVAGLLAIAGSAFARGDDSTPAASPTLYLVGDSTVRCGQGNGEGGMYGWGQVIDPYFDSSKIQVVNKAMGGRSSRTFLTEGRWQEVREALRPGDFVMVQFGHNDGGEMFRGTRPRASIKGNGEEVREGTVEATGEHEVVHSYGWYLRKYAEEAKQRGATPIILSLIPRDRWHDGKVIRSDGDYAKWAREAADQVGATFVDLNEIVSQRYEEVGQVEVHATYFTPQDHTHTSLTGARVNASCVVAGTRQQTECPLRKYLLPPDKTPASEPFGSAVKRFDFGTGEVARGYYPVTADMAYTSDRGYGFESITDVRKVSAGEDPLAGDTCESDEPFYFSVDLPEGNYRIEVRTPNASRENPVTIKAELRRLMVQESSETAHQFTVNLRRPDLAGGGAVRLKPREQTKEAWAWDHRLTLEINGPQPEVSDIVIQPAQEVVTLFLAGDSTVADQPQEPWASWGQMLPRFFQPTVVIANHAESGETVRGSLSARRFEKIFDVARQGDYLFIQFGHNDMKSKSSDALGQYRESLEQVVKRAQGQGVHAVLITSMERKNGVSRDTLADYPQTVRDLAAEMDVPLIDLHAMSKQLYKQLGDDLDHAFVDGTHHTSFGGYQLAKCVVAGIRSELPDLASHLSDDASQADGVHAIDHEQWQLPESPIRDPAVSSN